MNLKYTGVALVALLAAGVLCSPNASFAQETSGAALSDDSESLAEGTLLSADEIDSLMAPVALYPDTLLAQIFMASTYPLDVVKAGRFVEQNAETPEKDRAELAQQQAWDPSVQVLAAGFPDIVTRMNDHIDWTEQVGDAVLVQTDDVMDSVQRLRSQAADTGYLTSNDAQTVVVNVDNTISVAPTDPKVVYTPAYDPKIVYTNPAPANIVYVDSGKSTDYGDAVMTGLIVFGTAMILDNIFNDNDPWGGYWRGPPRIDWHNHDFHPRPKLYVNGDVNIGSNNRFTDINRARIGSINRDGIDRNHDRVFKPDAVKRAQARDKMSARKAGGAKPATLPSAGAHRNKGAGAAIKTGRPDRLKPAKVDTKIKHNKAVRTKENRPSAGSAKVSRPSVSKPTAKRASARNSAFQTSGGSRADAARARGKSSEQKRRR